MASVALVVSASRLDLSPVLETRSTLVFKNVHRLQVGIFNSSLFTWESYVHSLPGDCTGLCKNNVNDTGIGAHWDGPYCTDCAAGW